MSLKDILQENPKLTIEAFQRLQGEYDKQFISDEFIGFDKVRHTYAHMGKLFGRLAEYVQMAEDGHSDFSPQEITSKVIPDLLIYSAWLADVFRVDIEDVYLARFIGNIKRLHSDKIPPEELRELERCVSEKLQKPQS